MSEVIWVEIVSTHRDVLARQRCELGANGEAFIGRAYDNDVVLDDPFVAPRHARISRDETGRLVAEDLGSINGMFLDHETTRRGRIPLDGDSTIRLGRTWLRIRDASTAVAAEREEPRAARTWHADLVLTVALVGLTLLDTWLEDTGESKLSTYVFPLFAAGAFLLAWTSTWAVLARIFAGIARFERHLYFAMLVSLASTVVDTIAGFLAYSFSLTGLSMIGSFGAWFWLAVLSFLHLREIGPRHLVLKGAVVGTFAVLGIVGQMLGQAETGGLFGSEVAVTELKPPFVRLASPRTDQGFFEEVKALKAGLDRARTEEKPTGSFFDGFDVDD